MTSILYAPYESKCISDNIMIQHIDNCSQKVASQTVTRAIVLQFFNKNNQLLL